MFAEGLLGWFTRLNYIFLQCFYGSLVLLDQRLFL